eukprot:12647590-Alexandrium_andersonii.AAC.1
MPSWKTGPGPCPIKHLLDDPFVDQALGLPPSRTLVKLDDGRACGMSQVDEALGVCTCTLIY